jgi:membrane protease subunit (stomatin/prohibitin family)
MAIECPSEVIRSLVARVAHLADEGSIDDYVQSVWQFFVDTTTAPKLSSMGTYRDVFQRVEECWLLAKRSITTG